MKLTGTPPHLRSTPPLRTSPLSHTPLGGLARGGQAGAAGRMMRCPSAAPPPAVAPRLLGDTVRAPLVSLPSSDARAVVGVREGGVGGGGGGGRGKHPPAPLNPFAPHLVAVSGLSVTLSQFRG